MLKKILSSHLHTQSINIGLLILRLSVSILMIPHGYNKLIHFADKQEKFMSFMGLSGGASLALVIGAELFCSIFLALGLFTRFTLIPLIISMLVAIIHSHHGEIFGDGQEAFLYLIPYITLLITGAGKCSADHLLFREYSQSVILPAAEVKHKTADRSTNFEVGGES